MMNAVRTSSVVVPTTSHTTAGTVMAGRAYRSGRGPFWTGSGEIRLALGDELLAVVLVLEQEVELDEVVDRERGCLARCPLRVALLGELVEARLDRGGCRALVVDVHSRGHEERHDLAVGALLHGPHALGAHEPVEPLAAATLDGQEDGLGPHVHFPAPGAGRSDRGHDEAGIGD